MSALTATEIIAVKLLGWEKEPQPTRPEQWREYKLTGTAGWASVDVFTGHFIANTNEWPEFTHPRIQHYWVRRMEDALMIKGVWMGYELSLLKLILVDAGYEGIENTAPSLYLMLRSTPAQRVAAALKVIKQEGL